MMACGGMRRTRSSKRPGGFDPRMCGLSFVMLPSLASELATKVYVGAQIPSPDGSWMSLVCPYCQARVSRCRQALKSDWANIWSCHRCGSKLRFSSGPSAVKGIGGPILVAFLCGGTISGLFVTTNGANPWVFTAGAIVGALVTVFWVHRHDVVRLAEATEHCRKCGYVLTGLPRQSPCPECGERPK